MLLYNILALTLLLNLALLSRSQVAESTRCNPKKFPDGLVCVCESDQDCGNLDLQWPDKTGDMLIIQTTKSGKRFESSASPQDRKAGKTKRIFVDTNNQFQSILGWGGAFTDAFGINVKSLSPSMADKLLQSIYGEQGLQYNFGRVPIAGSDFSTRAYSYDDSEEPDFNLSSWKLAQEDLDFKIPLIQESSKILAQNNKTLKLFASPWSAPAWMKSTNSLVRGYLIDDDRFYQSYTNYLMNFYDAYAKFGINFWGATVQNEPIAAYLPFYWFNSMQFGNDQMSKFIGKYLGPELERRGWTKDKFKLMVGDDSLGFVDQQVPSIMKNELVQKYVAGIAFHWYTSGAIISYDKLEALYDSVKDHAEFMIMSEACTGSSPMDHGVKPGSWSRGQAYAADIIEDLNRHTSGWIDWNMALDMAGGPNWAKNFVDSPILVDKEKNEFYKQPMYYVLAHFSRLFKPGSVRVETSMKDKTKTLLATSVHNNQTDHLIINILNKSVKPRTVELSYLTPNSLEISDRQISVEPKSITSVVIKL